MVMMAIAGSGPEEEEPLPYRTCLRCTVGEARHSWMCPRAKARVALPGRTCFFVPAPC